MGSIRVAWRVSCAVGAAYSLFAALVSYGFTWLTGLSLWTLQPDASATFLYILLMNLWLWGGWSLFAPAIFELGRRFRFDRQGWRRALVVHVPAAALITSAHIVLAATGRFLLQSAWGVETVWSINVSEAFFRTLDFELPVYWAMVGLQHALDYYQEGRQREIAAAHLETRLVEAQLQALQRQLHPHFLFNTLHAICALVHRSPDKAEEMIERLSDLLRVTLDKVGIQQVTLAEELEYLRAYLDIEQVHFGDRLEISYEIDAHALDGLVPNLILQPLAENAIRHGLEPQAGRGRLTIVARREGEMLTLGIDDNGRGIDAEDASAPAGHGIGLTNARSRIEVLYRGAATMSVGRSREGGAAVTIRLPFEVGNRHENTSPGRRRSAHGARAASRVAC